MQRRCNFQLASLSNDVTFESLPWCAREQECIIGETIAIARSSE